MSDESPAEGGEPEATPPTEPAPAEPAGAPPGPAEAVGSQPPPPGPSAPPARTGMFVPKWLALVVAAVVAVGLLAGGGFAIGRATASGGHEREQRIERGFPRGPMERGGMPRLPAAGVFLGVGTRAASGGQQGVEIVNVVSGSAADQAGLKVGDVITAVDGSSVTGPEQLAQRVRDHQPGDSVKITYTRSGSSADVQVTLAGPPSSGTTRS